jgi:trans-aconitate methyltransferase
MHPSQTLAAEYSGKAAAYAQLWAPVIRPMALPLLEVLPLHAAHRVLDIGTGTGSLVADLQAAAPHATILGVDRAEGMLREGRHVLPHPVAVMDVQDLGIRSDAIDIALLVFVLFHTPDPSRSLTEVLRVLHGGGAVGIVTWGKDPGLPGLSIWNEELDREAAEPDQRDRSVMQQGLMDTTDKLSALLNSVGYERLRIWGLMCRHLWTVEDLLAAQIGCGMAARRLASLPATTRARCASRVQARLKELTPSDLTYCPEVLLAVAHRPV